VGCILGEEEYSMVEDRFSYSGEHRLVGRVEVEVLEDRGILVRRVVP